MTVCYPNRQKNDCKQAIHRPLGNKIQQKKRKTSSIYSMLPMLIVVYDPFRIQKQKATKR